MFSKSLEYMYGYAAHLSDHNNHKQITLSHILIGLIESEELVDFWLEIRIDLDAFNKILIELLELRFESPEAEIPKERHCPKFVEALQRSKLMKKYSKTSEISQLEFLSSVLALSDCEDILYLQQFVTSGDVRDFITFGRTMSPAHPEAIRPGYLHDTLEEQPDAGNGTAEVTEPKGPAEKQTLSLSQEFPYISRSAALGYRPGSKELKLAMQPIREGFLSTLTDVKQETLSDLGQFDENLEMNFVRSKVRIKFRDVVDLNFEVGLAPTGRTGALVSKLPNRPLRIVFDDNFPLFYYQAAKAMVELLIADSADGKNAVHSDLVVIARNVRSSRKFRASMMEIMVAHLRFGSSYFRRPMPSQSRLRSYLSDFFIHGFEQYVMSHEIAHAVLQHFETNANLKPSHKENDADAFANIFIFLKETKNVGHTFDSFRTGDGEKGKNFGVVAFLPLFFWGAMLYFHTFEKAVLGDKECDLLYGETATHPAIAERASLSIRALQKAGIDVSFTSMAPIYLKFLENIQAVARHDSQSLIEGGTLDAKNIGRRYKF